MKTMTITEFKAHALRAIATVHDTMEPLVVTKHGKPVVRVMPYTVSQDDAVPGKLAHMIAWEDDIVSPLGPDMWGATR